MKNERLIALREQWKLTQEQLGNDVGISQSMVARIEAGDREPRKVIRKKLARYFKVTVEWLFYELDDDETPSNDEHAATLEDCLDPTGTE